MRVLYFCKHWALTYFPLAHQGLHFLQFLQFILKDYSHWYCSARSGQPSCSLLTGGNQYKQSFKKIVLDAPDCLILRSKGVTIHRDMCIVEMCHSDNGNLVILVILVIMQNSSNYACNAAALFEYQSSKSVQPIEWKYIQSALVTWSHYFMRYAVPWPPHNW